MTIVPAAGAAAAFGSGAEVTCPAGAVCAPTPVLAINKTNEAAAIRRGVQEQSTEMKPVSELDPCRRTKGFDIMGS
jgi:hypothetical protein